MLPILLIGAVGLLAYGLSKKDRKPKDLPKKIRWNKRKDTFAKLVGDKFVSISEDEFDSLVSNEEYRASSRMINGVLTYTIERKKINKGVNKWK